MENKLLIAILSVFLFFSGAFAFTITVNAETLEYTTNMDTDVRVWHNPNCPNASFFAFSINSNIVNSGEDNWAVVDEILQDLGGYSINSLSFLADAPITEGFYVYEQDEGDISNTDYTDEYGCGEGFDNEVFNGESGYDYSITTSTESGYIKTTWHFGTPIEIGDNKAIIIHPSGDFNGGDNNTPYDSNAGYEYSKSFKANDAEISGSLWFQAEVTSANKDEITISYPTSSVAGDFENWEITYDTATSTTATSSDAYVAYIYGGYSSSTSALKTGGADGSDIVHDFESPKLIENITAFGEGKLYAFAELYFQPDRFNNPDNIELVATSDLINFDVYTEASEGYYTAPTSTATSSQWTFTCDPDSGFWSNSLCNLFRFLFVPTQTSVERFSQLDDPIKNKPPFGYWNEIKVEIRNISTSTAAFSLTGVDTLTENSTFQTIKTTISVLLWFLFTFWILHRIRNFDFHK